MKNAMILFRNCLGKNGREYRFLDPQTFRTELQIITDDSGEGAHYARNKWETLGIKWQHLGDFGFKTKERYQETMFLRIHRVQDQNNDDWKQSFGCILTTLDEYPNVLRGCDLDKGAEIIDIRHWSSVPSESVRKYA